jgi:hypothetical protein
MKYPVLFALVFTNALWPFSFEKAASCDANTTVDFPCDFDVFLEKVRRTGLDTTYEFVNDYRVRGRYGEGEYKLTIVCSRNQEYFIRFCFDRAMKPEGALQLMDTNRSVVAKSHEISGFHELRFSPEKSGVFYFVVPLQGDGFYCGGGVIGYREKKD